MTRVNFFKTFETAVTILFLLLIVLSVYIDISWHNSVRLSNILLPVTLILTIIYETKISWLIAVLLFAYGIYYYMFEGTYAAEPGSFEFTLPLTKFIFGNEHGYTTRSPFVRYFAIFPFVFYIVATIIFMTKWVRRQYWSDQI